MVSILIVRRKQMSKIVRAETTAKEETHSWGSVITYWVTTALLAFVVGSGGIGDIIHQWGTLETVEILRYPVYFLVLIVYIIIIM
jgi:ABC-type methionine transport system permease subunit